MAGDLQSNQRISLLDITHRESQASNVIELDDDDETPQFNIRTVTFTPSTPERVPIFESPVSSQWSPVTPPTTGRCTRSRSNLARFFSPQNLSFSSDLTPTCMSNLRVSPRKRLNLAPELQGSPKKLRFDLRERATPSGLNGLLALSADQLIHLIGSLIPENELQKKLKEVFPVPDLKYVDKELKHLKSSILKSVASRDSRLVSKTDAVAFARAQLHLQNFKKYLFSMGTRLTKSEQWSTVVEFVILAWGYVRDTPSWDKQCHNDIKSKCFKFLANQLAEALKNGQFSPEESSKIVDQVMWMAHDNEAIKNCMLMANNHLHSAPSSC